jgi:DNA-binding transcriptional regulator GbsR (MarR family)
MRSDLRKTRHFVTEELWSPLAVFAVPLFILSDGVPALEKNEEGVYTVLCERAENSRNNCIVTFGIEELEDRTGYSRSSVSRAFKGLREKKFIRPVGDRRNGSREALSFELTNPANSEGLALVTDDKRERRNLRSALYQAQLPYMNLPMFSVREIKKRGVARFLAFRALAAIAGNLKQRGFTAETAVLRKLSGLDQKTFRRELEKVNGKVIEAEVSPNGRMVRVTLIDPKSKQTLDDLEEQQKLADEEARLKRYDEENKERVSTPEQVLALALWCLKDLHPKIGGDGEFVFYCPECHNFKTKRGRRQQRPRFTVNPSKGMNGLAYCHDCDAGMGGDLLKYVANKTGMKPFEAMTKLLSIKSEEPAYYAAAQGLLGGFGGSKGEQPTAGQRKAMKQAFAERKRAEGLVAVQQPIEPRMKIVPGDISEI